MTPPAAKPVLGLIGAIGAGKSTAAAAFARRGGFVVDCDKLGHAALDTPAVKERLVARWGHAVLNADGTANRRAIGGIVFGNPAERQALEAIVFPVIAEATRDQIRRANADPQVNFVVLDAAVLLEAGWGELVDRIAYIDAPRAVRLDRLAKRSGWIAAELTNREVAQWPAERKKPLADAVIVNDGTPDHLQQSIDHVLSTWGW